MDAQQPRAPHVREKSRTRSRLIREKEDSVSRDNSVSNSAEVVPSLRAPSKQTKKQQHTQTVPPLVNNISTQSGKSGTRSRANSNNTGFKTTTWNTSNTLCI